LIRAVLFDIGETLVTSLENEEIHQIILREKGIEKSLEEIGDAMQSAAGPFSDIRKKDKLMGTDLDLFYTEWDSEVYKALGLKSHNTLGKYAHKRWFELAELRMFDDVIPVLNRLSAMGLRLGIITNGYYQEAREVMERVNRTYIKGEMKRLGLNESMFAVIVGRDTVGAEKPDPRPFLHAAGSLGLRPDEIMHVGDRYDKDYIGAQGVGMVPVLILRGRKLPAGVPDHVTKIQTLDELVNLIQ
jgi:HAD superfamily hydrolase (TIGR01549 family)